MSWLGSGPPHPPVRLPPFSFSLDEVVHSYFPRLVLLRVWNLAEATNAVLEAARLASAAGQVQAAASSV